MRPRARIIMAALAGLVVVAGAFFWFADSLRTRNEAPAPSHTSGRNPRDRKEPSSRPAVSASLPEFPDPNAPGTQRRVFVDSSSLDTTVFTTAAAYTGPVRDDSSIEQRAEAIRTRVQRGLADLLPKEKQLRLDSPPTLDQLGQAITIWRSLGLLYLHDGRMADASKWLNRALEASRAAGAPADWSARMEALLGIVALRQGEIENCIGCIGPSSCIFPIARQGVHQITDGSRAAINHFTRYLDQQPGDLRARWLLNLAYMTLGEYPEKVPPAYLIPLDRFHSKIDVGRFENVAPLVGLGTRGPGLAGGSIFDDFNGDGRPDLFVTSLAADSGAALFINRGDGTFQDRSTAAGLDPQVYALNAARADYDNDGNLDVLLLRGGWETPARMSLLRNKGHGVFEDVTVAAGLGEPIATEAAAWGDYDNDGRLDLYVCGEYLSVTDGAIGTPASFDARNRGRLYHNRGDGTFEDVAGKAGIVNEHYSKGAVWGDYDNDGRLDLFISNMYGPLPARLYHNDGDGSFHDVASELGVTGCPMSFSCLFWDYNNDGRLDILVINYKAGLAAVVADYLGLKVNDDLNSRLYRNLGAKGFQDVSKEVGLDRPIAAMSVNRGDIDNDGFDDLYFGTGWMNLSGLMPKVLLKNVEGRHFEDVTESSGTGHLQKGHGISFADYDDDGDLDIYAVLGGGFPGDKGYYALFRNPGQGRHWLKVRLVGTKTNRAALGARLRVDVKGPEGATRSIHRMIGSNGSFGGDSLTELIGLREATGVEQLTVTWPTSKTTQTFRDVKADQSLEITEGADSYRVLPREKAPTKP